MTEMLDRFTMWQYRQVRRLMPRPLRRYTVREMELKAKELQILCFCLVAGGSAVILDAVLNSPS